MAIDSRLPPEDLDEFTSILACGYVRYRQSRSRQPKEGLDNTVQPSVHVQAVNAAENSREQAAESKGEEQ